MLQLSNVWSRADVKARMGKPAEAGQDLTAAISESDRNVNILFTW